MPGIHSGVLQHVENVALPSQRKPKRYIEKAQLFLAALFLIMGSYLTDKVFGHGEWFQVLGELMRWEIFR